MGPSSVAIHRKVLQDWKEELREVSDVLYGGLETELVGALERIVVEMEIILEQGQR